MTPLWTAAEAHAAAGGALNGDWSANGVSIDTRSLKAGDMFVALKDVRDGHDFVDQAFAAGASACLVSRDVGRPGLLVDDVLPALERLGLAARARMSGICSAVTGSVGKTSVKEMLARIFRAAGPAHWSDKSFNNHWGVPLTLARMPRETARAIFEIGMNTPGEIAPRSIMAKPQIAMITRIAPAHLEGLGSVEAVADEKADIFAGLTAGGAALLPAADAHFERLRAHALRHRPDARVFTFAPTTGADAFPAGYETDGASSQIEVEVLGERVRVAIDAVGEHWAINVALALLAAKLADVALGEAADALSGYAPPAGRGVAEKLALPGGGEMVLVDDAYNANPASMRAALAGFANRPGRRLVALGEMRELGADSEAMHRELAGPVLATNPAQVFLSGEGMRPLEAELLALRNGNEPGISWASSVNETISNIKNCVQNGDALLIKGSNASGMSRVGQALREISKAALDGVNQSAQKASGTGDAV